MNKIGNKTKILEKNVSDTTTELTNNNILLSQWTQTSSGHLKKVTTLYDQTMHYHNIWQKTSDL